MKIINPYAKESYAEAGQKSKTRMALANPKKNEYHMLSNYTKCRDFLGDNVTATQQEDYNQVIYSYKVRGPVQQDAVLIMKPQSKEYWKKNLELASIPVNIYENTGLDGIFVFKYPELFNCNALYMWFISLYAKLIFDTEDATTEEELFTKDKYNQQLIKTFNMEEVMLMIKHWYELPVNKYIIEQVPNFASSPYTYHDCSGMYTFFRKVAPTKTTTRALLLSWLAHKKKNNGAKIPSNNQLFSYLYDPSVAISSLKP